MILTTAQLAARWGISSRTVMRWHCRDGMPAHSNHGAHRHRFDLAEVAAWIDRRPWYKNKSGLIDNGVAAIKSNPVKKQRQQNVVADNHGASVSDVSVSTTKPRR